MTPLPNLTPPIPNKPVGGHKSPAAPTGQPDRPDPRASPGECPRPLPAGLPEGEEGSVKKHDLTPLSPLAADGDAVAITQGMELNSLFGKGIDSTVCLAFKDQTFTTRLSLQGVQGQMGLGFVDPT